MMFLSLLTVVGLAVAAPSTSSSMDMSSSMSTMDMSSSAAALTSTSPEYTITALPAVESAPSCIFNCLIPIGLADPSGCDDVTEDCACLSAPSDVLDFLTDCVNTVCQSSTSAFGASATSLYESYCTSVYGNATFSQAFVAESSAAASSSIASVEASMTSSSSSATGSATGSSASASATKSDSIVLSPSLVTVGMVAIGGLACLVML